MSFTLVLGGARSGKSARAEAMVLAHHAQCQSPFPPVYIATAEGHDAEMTARIAAHQRMRAGRGWRTLEAPRDLVTTLAGLRPQEVVLIDCLTLWLTNHLLAGSDLAAEGAALGAAIAAHPGHIVAVSNEVGFGIVPENALARRFRDAAGRLHQDLALQAAQVELVVAGYPLVVKG
jgi:adenosylcobinamide kinase / adenosylcobinamide-phosphate guanylyltransferase